MTTDQLKTLIKYLQCKQGKFAKVVADKLSLGICVDDYLNRLIISSYILEAFYRYKVFDGVVTNAQTVQITSSSTEIVGFDINIGPVLLAHYEGVGDIDTINNYINNYINMNSATTGWYCTILGGSLYIYTYDLAEDFSNLLLLKFTTPTILTYTTSSLENNLDDIINAFNCLTICQLSDLKNRFLKLLL